MGVPNVSFNSWSEAFRRPFGAVKAGSTIYFSIKVANIDVIEVDLMIQRDGEQAQVRQMAPSSEKENMYYVKLATESPTRLYFYHFRIIYQEDLHEKIIYYGKSEDNYGGEGRLVSDPAQIEQYQITCFNNPDPAPDWYVNGVIYHIFIDRFSNGERHHRVLNPKKNTFIYATEEDLPYYIRDKNGDIVRWDFYGGNLSGIIDKLHDLKLLGVTILYLSPIFEASSNHKYDTANYRRIDPMFGDRKTFDKLINKARRYGIHIILDGVFNHVGADSIYFNRFGTYGNAGAYRDQSSPYRDWFTFHGDQDHYDCWWNISDLPTVNKERESYQKFIYDAEDSVVDTWSASGIGGWRLDVADELSDDFITGIRKSINRHEEKDDRKVLIGEVWEDASNKIAYGKRRHYLEGGMLHGVMNYPFRTLIIELINGKINARQAARAGLTLKSNYPSDTLFANMNNIGTHDTERILTMLDKDEKKLQLAIWLLMVLPGVPCVYYGDEAGLTGGKDPDNRRFYPWGRENRNILTVFQEAIQARRTDRNLQIGDFYPFSIGALFGCLRLQSKENYTVFLINPTTGSVDLDMNQFIDETRGNLILGCLQNVLRTTKRLHAQAFQILKSNE
jgi:glycosidase